ncbi:hypothetical protein ABB37_06112 [Leptomonas pyrrhocoris]|uniref:Phosphatidic acid phosphatase type 2/haloperoxidase domain-containing protein n=1 Tax=Leptomonas pyrrhocoris TaxID=157538 RepID=A0A0M9FYG3_LEPPY|nr:hypothetical protein ABB37_06112 [Leptomonas pyrrhocoris]KPA78499.1 hypothetical protein ABB37_06112 [Leptomonas pyrrhocoris]|eukprot:XP_015656938.1 hypothetical protein ABB37_06112 [Leptomonas pyrrhocoris]
MSCDFLTHHFFLWRVPDYLMIIIMAIIAAILGAEVRPHCRSFDWGDPSIGHPFATKETFPMYSVAIAVVFVVLVYFVGELCTRWSRPVGKLSMCLHINGWVVTHAYSILLAFVFVNVSKVYAGRLRPDFLARLAKEGITEANVASFSHDQLCRAARNGRLSFPSGHSGASFAGYVPPCLYLMGLMRTLNGGKVWLATIALFPLILPVAVAVSRTVDYRHNFDDIFVGSVCGTLCGIFAVLISFRVSMRGEWTLRDRPDDKLETRAMLRAMLTDKNGRSVVMVDAGDNRRRRRDADRVESSEDEATVSCSTSRMKPNAPRHPNARSVSDPQQEQQQQQQRSSDHAQSSLLSPGSLNGTGYLSPAVYHERAANPSPSTRHNEATSSG